MIGETLNHYKIVSRLGRGGMGEVYVAEDTRLDRKVALKVLPPELAVDAERRVRFEREAKAVAALNHPNIVTVYSVEQAGDTHFITMELVEGRTLTEIVAERRLPAGEMLDYAVELTDAVTVAHRKGITHRDLKPDNVMLADDGRIKVLDFGLAKVSEGVSAQGQTLPTQTVTQEGKILGTVAYMSPEQAEGKTVDARSDVFSIGVLLYEMATGEKPFGGDTSISTITAILRDTPRSVTDLNHSLPRHLGRIVRRCLEKDPERRYQTSQDLRNDLQDLREELQSGDLVASDAAGVPASPAPRRTGLVVTLGAVAIVAVVVVVALLATRGPARPPAPPASSGAAMEITPLTATGHASEATISADGRYVVYVVEEGDAHSLWVTQVSTGSRVQIVEASRDGLWDPAFSPDGELVYYCRYREPGPNATLQRIPTLGGASRTVMDDVDGRVSFSPDGQRFAFLRRSSTTTELVVAGIDGSDEKIVARATDPQEYGDPTWSPDGSVLAAAFLDFTKKGPRGTVVVLPPEGGEQRTIADEGWFDVDEMSWLPDGSGLVADVDTAMTNELWEIAYPSGRSRRIITDLNDYHGASLTADGTTLVTQQNESSFNLWTLPPDEGAEPARITSSRKGRYFDVGWTPDGRISYSSNAGGNIDVWTVAADGSDARRLTSDQALNAGIASTSDGKYVVFMSTRAETVNLWRADVDGGNPVQLTFGILDVEPEVTPDGDRVLYRDMSGRLFHVPIEGGEPEPFLEGRFTSGYRYSPDGTRVLVSRYHPDEDEFKLEVRPAEGGAPLATLEQENMGSLRWAPDGEALTFSRHENQVGNLWRQPLDGGEPEQITHFEDLLLNSYAWAPDGRLVLVRGSASQDLVLLRNFR